MSDNDNNHFFVYRVFYDDNIVYVGRTKQKLTDRFRNHFFAKPATRVLDINQVSKVEFVKLNSEADMNLYELYYILLYKPPLNTDDTTKDLLSVSLPELEWYTATFPLFENWKVKINQQEQERINNQIKQQDLRNELRELKNLLRNKIISEEEYNLLLYQWELKWNMTKS